MTTATLTRFTYTYPQSATPALCDVDLSVDGGVLAVTGESGSGKSTLLRVFNGLVPHFHGGTVRGTARVCDLDVLTNPPRRLAAHVGLLFQDPEAQAVYATVERDVAFGLENIGVARTEMRRRVDDALARMGIAELRARAVTTLSGGERQRLALAGLLAMQPRLLVLDEPLSQLDAAGAGSFMRTVSALGRGGTSIVIAEHRLAPVMTHADRAIGIAAGRIGPDRAAVVHESVRMPPSAGIASHTTGWALNRVTAGVAGAPVVSDITAASGGEVVVVTGANGSGKTTLLRTIAGLLPPLAGTVQRAPGRTAYLPQNPTSLLHRPSVRDEVTWTLRREPQVLRAAAVDAALDAFALREVADRYPRDLSNGQRQRAALAAVLVGRPALALLDEPTRGMDAQARAALIRSIAAMRAAGSSVVLATHDRELANAVADRTIHLQAGVARELQPVGVPA